MIFFELICFHTLVRKVKVNTDLMKYLTFHVLSMNVSHYRNHFFSQKVLNASWNKRRSLREMTCVKWNFSIIESDDDKQVKEVTNTINSEDCASRFIIVAQCYFFIYKSFSQIGRQIGKVLIESFFFHYSLRKTINNCTMRYWIFFNTFHINAIIIENKNNKMKATWLHRQRPAWRKIAQRLNSHQA